MALSFSGALSSLIRRIYLPDRGVAVVLVDGGEVAGVVPGG
jgi:hypothetical protein